MTNRVFILGCAFLMGVSPVTANGQNRKPIRATPPQFDKDDEEVFFRDAASLLQGELPSKQAVMAVQGSNSNAEPASGGGGSDDQDPMAWHKLVSAESLEDLIKGSKLRLDKIVTTPAAFAGGGFAEARKEFSMQALLFAIIADYPGDVRWKQSADLAREGLARSAANTKVGSIQSYRESKQRLLDLGDLLNGSQLVGEAKTETDWSNLIDRVPLMQLLEWAQQEEVSKKSASEAQFTSNKAELRRYAELIAVLGKASLQGDMPDATDDDYIGFANDMIQQARGVVLAVDTGDAAAARLSASKLGQSCTNCHDNFR